MRKAKYISDKVYGSAAAAPTSAPIGLTSPTLACHCASFTLATNGQPVAHQSNQPYPGGSPPHPARHTSHEFWGLVFHLTAYRSAANTHLLEEASIAHQQTRHGYTVRLEVEED
uniref:Uncharacterized protein n=1 Tax=Anopheles coluzzii TaxID=1518534 RepID=A0A8W7PNB6_ANOCL